jgi:hypothetical protein
MRREDIDRSAGTLLVNSPIIEDRIAEDWVIRVEETDESTNTWYALAHDPGVDLMSRFIRVVVVGGRLAGYGVPDEGETWERPSIG